MVSRLKHDNFVQLLGYCIDGNSRILAYEFASNGSLHDILHGMWFLLHVILNGACGYLHLMNILIFFPCFRGIGNVLNFDVMCPDKQRTRMIDIYLLFLFSYISYYCHYMQAEKVLKEHSLVLF